MTDTSREELAWGIAAEALRVSWWDTETAARRVAERAAEREAALADKCNTLERTLALADDQRREWEHHCKTAEAKCAALEAILNEKGPVYSGPMVDAAFARAKTAEAKCAALEESLLQANERLLWFENGLEEGARERDALEAQLATARREALVEAEAKLHLGIPELQRELSVWANKLTQTRRPSVRYAVRRAELDARQSCRDKIRAMIKECDREEG